MFEFDVSLTVTSSTKRVPYLVHKTVKAVNKLDLMTLLRKDLKRKGLSLHAVIDVLCFRVNIRKERVLVPDDDLFEIEREQGKFLNLGPKPNLFLRKQPWDF